MRNTEREAEIQAEGEAGSMQGAQCRTGSQDQGSRPEPKADSHPMSHPGASDASRSKIAKSRGWLCPLERLSEFLDAGEYLFSHQEKGYFSFIQSNYYYLHFICV